MDKTGSRYHKPRATFAAWLLTQNARTDQVGSLAKAAATDRQFPRNGDVAAVSRRLNETGADGDLHIALEDAELDYLSL